MEYKVQYNGQETNDFNVLASWFQELKKENERLKEANEQHRDDYIRLKLGYDEFKQRNRDLEEENKNLKTERSKTNEVLKRYCGDSVDAPISTMVGLIIDDYFYQKNETEHQVKALQKAETTIEKLNKELVEYADKVEELEKMRWLPDWCQVIDKLDEIIDEEAPFPSQLRKVFTNAEDEIWYKLDYLAKALGMRRERINDLDVTNRGLKLENEKLIHVQGDNAIEHATEIVGLKGEIADLNKAVNSALEDVEKYKLRYKMALVSYYGMGSDAEIHKLREENDKLKRTLEFCQKEASSAREHAHNVEVNAERIRKGLD